MVNGKTKRTSPKGRVVRFRSSSGKVITFRLKSERQKAKLKPKIEKRFGVEPEFKSEVEKLL